MSNIFVGAHRGVSITHPENTLPAFEEAVRLGCKMIEFDIRATSDGKLIVLHDDRVDRTTDGKGFIWDLSYREVVELDAATNHVGYSDIRIPLLEHVLDTITRDVQLNIHVYSGPGDGMRIAKNICETIKSRDLYNTVFVASLDPIVEHVRKIDNKVRRCLLGSMNRMDRYIDLSEDFGCSNIQPAYKFTTIEFCQRAKRLGLTIHPYYPGDDLAEMQRLIDCGVDGILTDYPHLLIDFIDKSS
tara:strand:- start:925 stop:1656 length:732 start_codon:yes stop_codon:yes gene_type:complete